MNTFSFFADSGALAAFSFANVAQAQPVVSGSFTLNYLSSQMFSTDDDDA